MPSFLPDDIKEKQIKHTHTHHFLEALLHLNPKYYYGFLYEGKRT